MNEKIIDFINRHAELIDTNEWEEVYRKALSNLYGHLIGEFTTILFDADIHPEKYLSVLPMYFLANTNIKNFEIPTHIKNISYYVFRGCSNLTSINIPEGVRSIGDVAFSGCESLTNVTIGNDVQSLGNYAFSGCSSLTSIELPDALKIIGDYAFSFCKKLKNIVIPNGVTEIHCEAFCYCENLKRVTIPDSVTKIGKNAFLGCGERLIINYSGTKAQFKSLTEDVFTDTYYTCHCIDGNVIKRKK